MRRRPPRSTRNEPLFPNATLSRSPGQGTRFSVALPLPVAQAPVATPARGATGGGTITGPLQLLLVEDDPTVAEVVTGLLRAQGHAVVHAAHGLAALSETAARSFDLRSEEHTSELQSLKLTSYAVFCLQNKTN